jgi:glucose/arabinose dehydrogenase
MPAPDADRVRLETIARGLDHPWSLAFLPDGRMLITERPGRLRLVAPDGTVSPPIPGVPAVAAAGQGGLLDIVLDPAFATSGTLYLAFAEAGEGGTAGTSVARARLTPSGLADLRVIYRQHPKVRGGNHFGARLVFARDGTLFVTQGDRYAYRDQAQDLASLLGKIVRLNPDGTVPPDNPFVGRPGARPEIWSYGHRNVQGATLDTEGQLVTAEHGARGGDEVNRPLSGRNYGWPVITYGVDYSGARIGTGTAAPGMEQPVHYWDPSIAPSGLTLYTGGAFPAWRGDLLVGALAGRHLARLVYRQGRVVAEYRYLVQEGARIRDVRQGPDGLVYLLTDSADGRLVRLRPR